MTQKRLVLPSSTLGKVGLAVLLGAVVLLAISMTTSFIARSQMVGTATNVLGILVPAFLIASAVGIVISWIAILRRKDRSVLLLVVAIIATSGLLFTIVAEIIEAMMMSNVG